MPSERTIRIGQTPEIGFTGWTEQSHQALLSRRALRRRELGQQFFLEPLASYNLPTLPTASVGNDFLVLVIDDDGSRVCPNREMAADVARRYTVTIAVKGNYDTLPIISTFPRR